MGSKAKVVDVNDAFGAANAMCVGDVFRRKHKKNTQKATDPPTDIVAKRLRPSSATMAVPTRLVSISTTSPDASSLQ